MPRRYPAPHARPMHINPYITTVVFFVAITALLLPTTASAGDRDVYGRQGYDYDEQSYAGDSAYLDDSYHAQYDHYSHRSSRRGHGYSHSYERDYNGRDYACGCRQGRTAYYRTYNWKGEHEYREASRRHNTYSSRPYGSDYDDRY
jgi:hypothetical protein